MVWEREEKRRGDEQKIGVFWLYNNFSDVELLWRLILSYSGWKGAKWLTAVFNGKKNNPDDENNKNQLYANVISHKNLGSLAQPTEVQHS